MNSGHGESNGTGAVAKSDLQLHVQGHTPAEKVSRSDTGSPTGGAGISTELYMSIEIASRTCDTPICAVQGHLVIWDQRRSAAF